MAQRVNVVLVDDLDGSDASETVTFGVDGVDYEVDLSAKHADELRSVLAPYLDVARKKSNGRRRKIQHAAAGAASAADIRTWARANGWDVPERGRVAAEVRDAYNAAH